MLKQYYVKEDDFLSYAVIGSNRKCGKQGEGILPKRADGFSLLETTIALAIFAVVALALAQLQISVIKQRIQAKKYAKAMFYAEDLLERVSMTPFASVNPDDMEGIDIPSPDDSKFERTLIVGSGNTIKLVTVKVKWKDSQGNYISKNSLQMSTKIWAFQ